VGSDFGSSGPNSFLRSGQLVALMKLAAKASTNDRFKSSADRSIAARNHDSAEDFLNSPKLTERGSHSTMRSAGGVMQGHLARENGRICVNQFTRVLQPVFVFRFFEKCP
jgi:hypothetical protein